MGQTSQNPVSKSILPNLPTVSIFKSLGVSIFLSAILSITIAWFFAENSPFWAVIPESAMRYLTSWLCLVILFVFLVLFVYAVSQYVGVHVDRRFWQKFDHEHLLWKVAFFVSGRVVIENSNAKKSASKHEFHVHKYLMPLQFGIWVLPLLGFIGTVIGISEAIAGLHPLVGSAGDTSTVLSQSIGRVLAGLETAFDTTLLGLLCVIPTMMATMFLRLQGYQLNLEINECVGKMMLE
jgi:hypothetical protein